MTITLPVFFPEKQRQSSIFLDPLHAALEHYAANIPSPLSGMRDAFPMYTIMNCLTGVC